jgi:hypothetical protein
MYVCIEVIQIIVHTSAVLLPSTYIHIYMHACISCPENSKTMSITYIYTYIHAYIHTSEVLLQSWPLVPGSAPGPGEGNLQCKTCVSSVCMYICMYISMYEVILQCKTCVSNVCIYICMYVWRHPPMQNLCEQCMHLYMYVCMYAGIIQCKTCVSNVCMHVCMKATSHAIPVWAMYACIYVCM